MNINLVIFFRFKLKAVKIKERTNHLKNLQTMAKKAVGQFRNTVWDPLLITSQIVAVQSLFYTTYGLLTFCVCHVAGLPISVAQMFDAEVCSECLIIVSVSVISS